jgi:hypothetical protein
MIVLPKECRLTEIIDIMQDLIQEKIKSQPLELACNMIHFELECVYSETNLVKVIMKKRFEEGDLTMLLAMSLLLLEFNDKSKEIYLSMIERLKKITIKEYMSIKTSLRDSQYIKRTVLKILKENKLLGER